MAYALRPAGDAATGSIVLGQRVNNFEIVRLLGEGGMGAVYEAKQKTSPG